MRTERISWSRAFINTAQNSSRGKNASFPQRSAARSAACSRRGRSSEGACTTLRPSSTEASSRVACWASTPVRSSSPAVARDSAGSPRCNRRGASSRSSVSRTSCNRSSSQSDEAPSLRMRSPGGMPGLSAARVPVFAKGEGPKTGHRKRDPGRKTLRRRKKKQFNHGARGAHRGLLCKKHPSVRSVRSVVDVALAFLGRGLEAGREGEEGLDLVVGLAQARRERAHEGPEQLVGQVLVQEQQLFHVSFLDHVQGAGHVRRGIGRARRVVDQRHLAEVAPRLEDGERLLAHSRDHLGDAYLPGSDEVHLRPHFPFLEDALVGAHLLLGGDGGYFCQMVVGQVREERDLLELGRIHGATIAERPASRAFPGYPAPPSRALWSDIKWSSSAPARQDTPPPSTPHARISSRCCSRVCSRAASSPSPPTWRTTQASPRASSDRR